MLPLPLVDETTVDDTLPGGEDGGGTGGILLDTGELPLVELTVPVFEADNSGGAVIEVE